MEIFWKFKSDLGCSKNMYIGNIVQFENILIKFVSIKLFLKKKKYIKKEWSRINKAKIL